jgi:hypothetical protein
MPYYLIIRKLDNRVFQIENVKPPDGAYKEAFFEVKYWLGALPRKESFDIETGVLIPGDIDPTLTLDKDALRALAFVEGDGTNLYELADTLDAIVEDLNGELSADTKEKAKKVKDKVKKIKDKYP